MILALSTAKYWDAMGRAMQFPILQRPTPWETESAIRCLTAKHDSLTEETVLREAHVTLTIGRGLTAQATAVTSDPLMECATLTPISLVTSRVMSLEMTRAIAFGTALRLGKVQACHAMTETSSQ